jgi:hypothetical protein
LRNKTNGFLPEFDITKVKAHYEACQRCRLLGPFGQCPDMNKLIDESAANAVLEMLGKKLTRKDELPPAIKAIIEAIAGHATGADHVHIIGPFDSIFGAPDPIEAARHSRMEAEMAEKEELARRMQGEGSTGQGKVNEQGERHFFDQRLPSPDAPKAKGRGLVKANGEQRYVDIEKGVDVLLTKRGNTKLVFRDISDEKYRRYVRMVDDVQQTRLYIPNPVAVAVGSFGQRIVDAEGKGYYIDHGAYDFIEWDNREGAPRVNF